MTEPQFAAAVEHEHLDVSKWDEIYVVGDVHGCRADLERLLTKLEVTDDDLVAFVGDLVRKGPDSKGVLDLVREVYEDHKIVGMICHAGLVGISADIVEGSDATGSRGIKDDLENAGATWVDEPAFRDGNLVWGRVVADIPEYCRVLVDALAKH